MPGRRLGMVGGAALAALLGAALLMTLTPESVPDVRIDPPEQSTQFDPAKAEQYLKDICKLGPRLTGGAAMKKQVELLTKHFEHLGATVELQRFRGLQPSIPSRPFACVNLVVRWHPERERRVLLGVHYDTRPAADEEPIARNRRRFAGANDGASGVAFLMELGRLMPTLKTTVGVDFVCFDAEEHVFDYRDNYFIGSQHFVKDYLKRKATYSYDAVVVLDMIGDKNLELRPDLLSFTKSGPLVKEIWGIAAELSIAEFSLNPWPQAIRDDHEPFIEAGINACDLIDWDYPHWHRLSDTPDKCSGESLEKVARVMIAWLGRRK